MKDNRNKIAVYGSRRQDNFLEELAGFFSFLDKAGFRVVIHTQFATYLEEMKVDMARAIPVNNLPSDTTLVVSIGGDGTFLRAARWIGDKEIPIFGINTGHLGYLSSCSINEASEMIEMVCRGEILLERRMLLHVESENLPDNVWPYALNELAVTRDEISSVISVKAWVNDNFIADYRSDGLIVATPTGSTAYSLSAGGPILEPTLNCMALSPIAPHTLTLRPLVIGGDSELRLKVESRFRGVRLSMDDRSYPIVSGSEIKITRAAFAVIVIRKKDSNFAAILRDKLLWSASGE